MARFIFNIEISGTKTSKPILTMAFTQALIAMNTTKFSMSKKKVKYDENDLLESSFSKRNNF